MPTALLDLIAELRRRLRSPRREFWRALERADNADLARAVKNIKPQAVLATVCAFEARYDLPVVFVPTAGGRQRSLAGELMMAAHRKPNYFQFIGRCIRRGNRRVGHGSRCRGG